jgi:small ligand-binding sensory domain FIST
MSVPAAAVMRWASAQSDLPDAALAAEDVARALREQLGEGPVDLVLAFYSAPLAARADAIASALRTRLAPLCMGGVSARGVVTREHEIEQGVALSVIAARLPGVTVAPLVMMQEVWSEPVADDAAFDMIAPGMRGAELILFAGDPFSLDVERILGLFHKHVPGSRIVGGLASAGVRPQSNTLFLNDWTTHEGGFALALHGALRADVIVSQGCAPVGPPLDVTHVEGHVIVTLDGLPALERIEQVLRELPEAERERLREGLYVGRPARGDATGRGDYLIRNLLGADRERGAIAVADTIGLREKIRLHVRDARAATEDLEMLLSPQAFDTAASGALLFACNGRGRMLFGEPDRDIVTLQESLNSPVPVAGMFCAGEVGPVGEKNFLHGHTASIAIIRPLS